MKQSHLAWCLAAVVLIFGPVAVRVWSWQRSPTPTVEVSLVKAGETLFNHEWQVNDPLCNGGDGLGPVFNARSCVACHNQGGVGGGGDVEHNVTTFLVAPVSGVGTNREGVVHGHATSDQHRETLAHVDSTLPALSQPKLDQLVSLSVRDPGGRGRGGANLLSLPTNVRLSQRNTPALFGLGLIDQIPERVILANERVQKLKYGLAPGGSETEPVGRVHRLANGKIGRFGWKAQLASLADFVEAACANELGLGNPNQAQPVSMANLSYKARGLDLTQRQCDELTAFVAALPRPIEKSDGHVAAGKALFAKVGCAQCHTPDLGSVEGVYSDLLLHRMGTTLEGGAAYYGTPIPPPNIASVATSTSQGPRLDEWRTPPLWGVADSTPYLHDGRAATLDEAIKLHGGQGARSAQQYESLRPYEQTQLVAFLKSLKAP